MAVERIVTPTPFLAGTTNRATLTIKAGKQTLKVKGVGSYRLRMDGSRFSVRATDSAGCKNACVIEYRGEFATITIRNTSGATTDRVRVKAADVSLTLSEGTYPVIVA